MAKIDGRGTMMGNEPFEIYHLRTRSVYARRRHPSGRNSVCWRIIDEADREKGNIKCR